MAANNLPAIVTYYQEYKAAIFTSSLTLGTFLFSMKTFIIQTMKKDVYEKPEYIELVSDRQKDGLKEELFTPLKNFKALLFFTILFSFSNAILQLVLGYFKNTLCVSICFSATALSWGLTVYALFQVSRNLTDMIDISERMLKKNK